MSRDDGFAVADVDSGYFDDAKMRDLWHALKDADRMARAICLHSATLLASWRQGCRVTVAQAIPLWLPADADLIAALQVAKLLDHYGKIPSESWKRWFGAAYGRREVRRESGRAGGLAAAQRRALPGEHPPKRAQRRYSVAPASPEQTTSPAEPVRPSVPTVPTVRADTNADGLPLMDEDATTPAYRWLAGHGAYLDPNGAGKLQTDLDRLVEIRSIGPVLAEFERLAKNPDNRTPVQFVYGADRALNRIESAPTREAPDMPEIREIRERVEASRRARETGATA